METITTNTYNRQTQNTILLLVIGILMLSFSSKAQFRNYTKVYSDNIRGGSIIFGNTLTHVVTNGNADTSKMNNNRTNGTGTSGNDGANIQYVDIDGNTGAGAATRNSSSSDLLLPAGTNTIKLARLYWGARVKVSEFNLAADSTRTVKIKFGTAANYTEYKAGQIDKNTSGTGNNMVNQYQAYTDITSFIQSNGSGTYTIGNVPASTGAVNSGGNYAGWCIVVVYENTLLNEYNSVRVYDGFQVVYNSGAPQVSSVTLTGLNVPSGAISLRDAKMGAMVWEGDANLKLDYLKINGTNFYNSLNAIDNPWNGTITDTGVHVTNKLPNYTNQMGIDIDQFYAGHGYGIQQGDTIVHLEFGTEADQYFPGLFTFQIKTKDPTVVIDKLVQDAGNNRIAEPGEILTYTIKGKNVGEGNANFCVITDTLPDNVTFIPGSVQVIINAGITAGTYLTDDAGDDQAEFDNINNAVTFRAGQSAGNSAGGILAPGESFEIQFKVKVNLPATGSYIAPVINIARITAYSDAGIKSTDDATAILEPMDGPLPVTLKSFTAILSLQHTVKINWMTSMEINCRSYEIERSIDGKNFIVALSIAGSGNSSSQKNYIATDNIGSLSAQLIYYRLKQVDFDGKQSYSKVIAVRVGNVSSGFTVSPNPFANYTNITLNWHKNESSSISIFSMSGKEMIAKNIQLNKGTNYISMTELSTLAAGVYVIRLNTAEGKIFKQVVKQ